MSHKLNKFSGQGSPLILNWYLSTSLNNHKWSSIIQHNWQSSVGNIVGVDKRERCYCLFRVMPQLMRSTEETVATEMALDFPGLWAEKQHLQHIECLVLLLKLATCLSSTPQTGASIFTAHPFCWSGWGMYGVV